MSQQKQGAKTLTGGGAALRLEMKGAKEGDGLGVVLEGDALVVSVEHVGLADVEGDGGEAVDLLREAPEVLRVARRYEERGRHRHTGKHLQHLHE